VVLGVLIVVAGIAVVDSLNPATIGPALVLTMSAHPVRRVLEFAAGFFLVNVVGGVLLVLGPGRWLLSLVPHLSDHAKHLLEIGGGIALIVAGVVLLAGRRRFVRDGPSEPRQRSGSGFATGVAIAAAELPTALPYFAAIAAIAAADLSSASELALVLLFNIIFVAPVVAIAVLVGTVPSLRQTVIEPVRRWMSTHWPQALGGVLVAAGLALLAIGVVGAA